jgi:hypothetical protein
MSSTPCFNKDIGKRIYIKPKNYKIYDWAKKKMGLYILLRNRINYIGPFAIHLIK